MKITLPKDYHDVTVGQFQRLHALPEMNAWEHNLHTLAILSGKTLEQIKEIDLGDLRKLINAIGWMGEVPATPKEFPSEIQYDGVTYRVIPEGRKLNVGELATLEAIPKDTPALIIANMHKILAAYIKPKGESNFNERATIFQNQMSIAVAYPLAFFFLELYKTSLQAGQAYLENEARKKTKELKRELKTHMPSSSNGLRSWTRWLKGMRNGMTTSGK